MSNTTVSPQQSSKPQSDREVERPVVQIDKTLHLKLCDKQQKDPPPHQKHCPPALGDASRRTINLPQKADRHTGSLTDKASKPAVPRHAFARRDLTCLYLPYIHIHMRTCTSSTRYTSIHASGCPARLLEGSRQLFVRTPSIFPKGKLESGMIDAGIRGFAVKSGVRMKICGGCLICLICMGVSRLRYAG